MTFPIDKTSPGRHRASELEAAKRQSRAQRIVAEAAGWLILAIIAYILTAQLTADGERLPTGLLGALCWLLGTRIFLGHGGPLLTAQSIFGFAFAIFFGVGGVYHAILASDFVQPWLRLALLVGFLAQTAIFFGFWYPREPTRRHVQHSAFLPRSSHSVLAALGAVTFLAAVAWRASSTGTSSFQSLALATAFCGATVTTAALILHDRARLFSMRTVAVLVMLCIFVRYAHPGTGRLLIVALGFSTAMIYALRFRTMLVKVAVLVATAPVLWWMARDRLALINGLATGDSYGRTGLESAVRPPQGFAELLFAYQAGDFATTGGRTFLSLPAMFIPDRFWGEKPLAFGYDLAGITAPSRFGTGYSDASSIFGEWLFSFGYLGLFVMVPVIGLAVPLLDRMLTRCLRVDSEPLRLLAVSAAVTFCAGVPDLVWSGLHTYGVRSMLRLPLLLIPLGIAAVLVLTRPASPAGLPGLPGLPQRATAAPTHTRLHNTDRRARQRTPNRSPDLQ